MPEATQVTGICPLVRSIGYALECVEGVHTASLDAPTPCAQWNLGMLMWHVNDSLLALHEGIALHTVGVDAPEVTEAVADHPVATFETRALQLLRAWSDPANRDRMVTVGDLPLSSRVLAGTGAVEMAVHGWDISQACGTRTPVPPLLARELLGIAEIVIDGAARDPLFGPPVAVPPDASSSVRLIAYLGRTPLS